MRSQIIQYLKRKDITNVDRVNTLFVTAFIIFNDWEVRNNKLLLKYLSQDDNVSAEFIHQLIKNGWAITLEDLEKLFEFVISPEERIVTGAVYTPRNVRTAILSRCLGSKSNKELRNIRIADISCGCGGFLLDAALWIHRKTGKKYYDIFRENTYGIDVQDYSIERTKILLSLLALSEGEDANFEFNLLCRDTLDYVNDDWNRDYKNFDVIVGNPPYVCSRKLTDDTRNKLKKYEVCKTGHPDLYIPFLQIAVEMLSNEGFLGYITMNTFQRSVNGRALRQYLSTGKYDISVLDFRGHQIFESKNTYTCLFFLAKGEMSSAINYAADEFGRISDSIKYKSIPYDELDDIKGWALNDFDVTKEIESKGIQIKDYCPSRHGIATLSNRVYIFRPFDEDEDYFYIRKSKGERIPIEKKICRDIINSNKLNSINEFDRLTEKVIFPYYIAENRASVIEPETMCRCFPCTWKYLNEKKHSLLSRDKGNTKSYPQWYAFGRTQSLVLPRYKLFFPKIANKPLRCIISDNPELMLYNGMAFVNGDIRKLEVLKAIIESKIFWNYIKSNGKPYASGYYSLSGNDIKYFGIPKLTIDEENELLSMRNQKDIDVWMKKRY